MDKEQVEVQLAESGMGIASQYFIYLVMSYKHKTKKNKINSITTLALTAFGIIPHESICIKAPCFSALPVWCLPALDSLLGFVGQGSGLSC